MTENLNNMFYPSIEERFQILDAQNAQVPVTVALAWQGKIDKDGEHRFWKGTQDTMTSAGWYATHNDGSITIRDRLASEWKNHVIPKTCAVYQIPREKREMFKVGDSVRYIRTEGAVNKYYGMHRITEIRFIFATGGKSYRYELHMVYTGMPLDLVKIQKETNQRSISEHNHMKLLSGSFIDQFNLYKPSNMSIKLLYEPVVLQGRSGNFSYTPDFVFVVTRVGYQTHRTHIVIESKSSSDAMYEPGIDEKIKLVTDYHNMHLLLIYGSLPHIKYIPSFCSNWQTKYTNLDIYETIQLLIRLASH